MSLKDYMALDGPAPTEHVAYGPAPLQYIEYVQPTGPGPYPVAVLIHGGCFLNAFQGIPQLRGMAAALAAKGIAVWNVEYRGLDSSGGGYPGTFLDVRSAIDLLQAQAQTRHLDLQRLVVVGHSAGAALSLWLAGRAHLPQTSPLFEPGPLPIPAVVALGGFADLRPLAEHSKQVCDFEMPQLTGKASAARHDPYVDTNPFDLLPLTSKVVFINGDHDTIVPPQQSVTDAARLRTRGGTAKTLVLPNASHFDEVAASSPSWSQVEPEILEALKARPPL